MSTGLLFAVRSGILLTFAVLSLLICRRAAPPSSRRCCPPVPGAVMAPAVLPYGYKLSSGSGSTACWLPVALPTMATAKSSPKSVQSKIEKLEQKKIIMQSKIDLLLKGLLEINEQLTQLLAHKTE